MAEIVRILPPQSFMGTAPEELVEECIRNDEMDEKYREPIDRESAYEIIMAAREELMRQQEEELQQQEKAKEEKAKKAQETKKTAANTKKSNTAAQNKVVKTLSKSANTAVRSASSSVSRSVSTNIVRSVTGGKKISTGKIAERAATNALSGAMRTGINEILRGLFGNKK